MEKGGMAMGAGREKGEGLKVEKGRRGGGGEG